MKWSFNKSLRKGARENKSALWIQTNNYSHEWNNKVALKLNSLFNFHSKMLHNIQLELESHLIIIMRCNLDVGIETS